MAPDTPPTHTVEPPDLPSPTPEPPPAPDMSLPQRIWGSLVSPRSVFETLRSHPRALGAILVLVLLFMVAGFLQSGVSLQQQLDQLDARQDMTEEGRATAEKGIRIFTTYGMPFAFAAGAVIGIVAIAGILLFLGNVVLGGDGRYKQYLAGTAHVQMVSIPMLLVRIPLVRATGDLQTPTSLAALLSPDRQGSLLYQALAQFDVFGLWQLGLSVILVSVMAKVETKRAAMVVVGAWILWSAIWVPVQVLLAGLRGS